MMDCFQFCLNFAYNFNLLRYNKAAKRAAGVAGGGGGGGGGRGGGGDGIGISGGGIGIGGGADKPSPGTPPPGGLMRDADDSFGGRGLHSSTLRLNLSRF